MPRPKLRVFMIGVLISFAVVFALPAAAACYECTYIWFVGHECDSGLEQGETGKDGCNDTGPQCYLIGSVCPTEGGGTCGDGQGGCEPETGTFPESDRSVVRLAEAAVGPAPRAAAPQCQYRID